MKQKVLFVIHQLNIGGAQKAAISALDAIDYTQNDVTVYVRKKRLDLLPLLNKNITKVIINEDNSRYYLKPYAILLQVWQLIYKLLGKDKDAIWIKLRNYIVSCQMAYEKKHYFSDGEEYDLAISYLQGFCALFVAKCVHAKRKVMFYHGSTDALHEINQEVMADFSAVYCVTAGAQRAVRGFYPQYADKIRYIENIVPYRDIRKKADEYEITPSKAGLVLCSCGRLSQEKGYDIALQAAHCLMSEGIDFTWYFVGDGPERSKLENMASSPGVEKHVVFAGMQSNPYPYIKNCHIYVQPSREEAQCLTIIEAQILLRPVVSTRTVGGMALIKENVNGILTDIDGNALAEGITQLAKDSKARENMSQALQNIDYEAKETEFKAQWAKLLFDPQISTD